jgi:hypothetical protein
LPICDFSHRLLVTTGINWILDKLIQDVIMDKDFTIDVEVRLIAHWNTPMDSPEEWERRRAVNDRLGVIACELDEAVGVLVERVV